MVAQVLLLLFFCATAVETCLYGRLGRKLKNLSACATRSSRIPRYRASDHWKQKAMLLLSGRMMKASLALGMLLLIAFAPVLGWALAGDPLEVLRFSLGLPGLLSAVLFGTLYLRWRLRNAA